MTDKCKEIWENAASVLEAFERISQVCPNCECEGCSASIFSRGAATGNEIVIRRHFSPIHHNRFTGKIDKSAYYDVFRRGLSVNRKEHTTPEEIHTQTCRAIEISRESPDRVTKTGCEYAIARCGDLMDLKFADGIRMCCIYDTANKNDRSHADVVYSGFRLSGKISSGRKKQLVKGLATLFQPSRLRDIFPQ